MKKIFIYTILFLISANVYSQKSSEKISKSVIKVLGNCESCKKRIENAADIKGVKNAIWDEKTETLTVIFRSDKTSLSQIEKAIAAVGHDTENLKAENTTYQGLPACCKYREGECTEKGK